MFVFHLLLKDMHPRVRPRFFDQVGHETMYILVTATLSGILKAKQKLGRTFNSGKLGGIDFTKISKLTMCSA